MIETRKNKTLFAVAVTSVELLYHTVVRNIRKQSGGAALGLLAAMSQSLMMLAIFFIMYSVLGLRSSMIRGDFVIFLLTGIFLFLLHNRAISSISGAASATDPMNLHTAMNTLLSITASALSAFYLQVLSFLLILFIVSVVRGGLEFYDPVGLLFPFFMAWLSGVAIGFIILVLTPFAPKLMGFVSITYRRANMITSGKMLPVNYMTPGMVKWFAWNPLFHCIDQARGAAFVNYFPHRTNMEYPVIFTISAIMFALMVESWLRKNMSASWSKR